MNLISIARAKAHSRITTSDEDQEIVAKIQDASSIVMDYLGLSAFPDEWGEGSPVVYFIPGHIQAATLLVFAELWENREASNLGNQGAGPLSNTVKSLLHRSVDPSLA